jgi:hypothetical protein
MNIRGPPLMGKEKRVWKISEYDMIYLTAIG